MHSSKQHRRWITSQWRDKLIEQLNEARLSGKQDEVDRLQKCVAEAVVVAPEDIMPWRVQFGSRITVFSLGEEEEQTFRIVSADEAAVAKGLLDESSPLAMALLGAREGDVVIVRLPTGSACEYEVTHIYDPMAVVNESLLGGPLFRETNQ